MAKDKVFFGYVSNVWFLVGDEWFYQPAVGFGMYINSIDMWAVFQTLAGCFIWEMMLPSYMEIIISHCKDPYQPTSTMERHKGLNTA